MNIIKQAIFCTISLVIAAGFHWFAINYQIMNPKKTPEQQIVMKQSDPVENEQQKEQPEKKEKQKKKPKTSERNTPDQKQNETNALEKSQSKTSDKPAKPKKKPVKAPKPEESVTENRPEKVVSEDKNEDQDRVVDKQNDPTTPEPPQQSETPKPSPGGKGSVSSGPGPETGTEKSPTGSGVEELPANAVLVKLRISKDMSIGDTISVLENLNLPLLFGSREEMFELRVGHSDLQVQRIEPYHYGGAVSLDFPPKAQRQVGKLRRQIFNKTNLESGQFFVERTASLEKFILRQIGKALANKGVQPEYAEFKLTRSNGFSVEKIRSRDGRVIR